MSCFFVRKNTLPKWHDIEGHEIKHSNDEITFDSKEFEGKEFHSVISSSLSWLLILFNYFFLTFELKVNNLFLIWFILFFISKVTLEFFSAFDIWFYFYDFLLSNTLMLMYFWMYLSVVFELYIHVSLLRRKM